MLRNPSAFSQAGMAPQFLSTDVVPASLPCLEQGLDIDATQLQSLLNREFLRGKDLLARPHPHGHARPTPPSLTSQAAPGCACVHTWLFYVCVRGWGITYSLNVGQSSPCREFTVTARCYVTAGPVVA